MAAQWSLNQVLDQLVSGRQWNGNVITFSFPGTAGGLFSQGEAQGFRPVAASQQALMTLALQTWDDLIPQSMQPGTPGSTAIEFGYTNTSIGYAHAYFPENGSAWFNSGENSLTQAEFGGYGFLTFVHEIGHALGLNHMGDYNGAGNWAPSSFQDSIVLSVMSYFGPRNAAAQYSPEVASADWTDAQGITHEPQTPMVNDIAAIQSIYGASPSTRLGDTTYGFHSNVGGATGRIFNFDLNPNPILTIFDSGGTDTLDLSGWATPSRIDLRGGAYSSANSMTNNIAIALNTLIENAVGGSGADVLIGNAAANRLDGGAGNDELYGEDGDDMLIGGSGNDFLEGGPGSDLAVLGLRFVDYTVVINGEAATLTGGGGVVRTNHVERFQFADGIRSLAELGGGTATDTRAPSLIARSPADDASQVSTGANLVLTFDEPVLAGGGTIRLLSSSGALVREIAANDARQVTVNGATVTVNPDTDLLAGTAYVVNIDANAFRDAAGNRYAGISGLTAWNFDTAASATGDDYPMNPNGAGVLVPGGPALNARIDSAADGDLFKVTLTAGVTYQFEMNAPLSNDVDPYLVLYGPLPGGELIDFDDDSGGNLNSLLYFTPSLSGTFFLAAFDYADATGDYSLRAVVPTDDYLGSTATNGRVNIGGTPVTGRIGVPTDIDNFAVTLTAGESYTFELLSQGATGLEDPYLVLLGPDDQAIAYDDDSAGAHNARLSFTANASGTYYLSATDFDHGVGTYSLSATRIGGGGGTGGGTINGSTGPDRLNGSPGNDIFFGGGGDDRIDGGAGIDTARYVGLANRFELTRTQGGWLLRDTTGGEGTDTLVNIERLQFATGHWALDIDGHAGTAVRILGAVFGPQVARDPTYVGIGLALLDGGMSTETLLGLALQARLGPQPDNADVVNLLYRNVVGVEPGREDFLNLVGLLTSNQYTQAGLAGLAADHPLNLAHIDFVGLQQIGLAFDPWSG